MIGQRAVVAVAMTAALWAAGTAHAALPSSVPRETWIPDAPPNAIAVIGSRAYVGGSFGRIGPYTGAFPRIDRATGEARAGWPDVVGTIEASVSDGAGGWFIGGEFSHVGGAARTNLAHITADGTVDPAFAPVVTGTAGHETVAALLRIGSTLYLGGTLTSVEGQARTGLAAVDTTTGAPTSFAPSLAGGLPKVVRAINGRRLGPTTTLWVGGSFLTVDGQTRVGFASFTNGTLNTLAPVLDGTVEDIEPDALSGLFLAGTFTTVNGTARAGVARVTGTEGKTTSAFDANLAGGAGDLQEQAVFDLARTAGGLYLAGDFETVGGAPRPNLALVDPATGAAAGWAPATDAPAPGRWLRAMMIDEAAGTVFAGGRGLNVRAYDAATGARGSWAPLGRADDVATIESAGSDVVVGGSITVVGGLARDGFAEIDLLTGRPTALDVKVVGGPILEMAARGTALFLVGNFTQTVGPGGTTHRGITVLDTARGRWSPFALEPYSGDPVYWSHIALAGTTVWVTDGGEVRAFRDDTAGEGVATRLPLWGSVDGAGSVEALAGTPGSVVAGGTFTSFTVRDPSTLVPVTAPRASLVALGAQGALLPWDPGTNGAVRALAHDGATVFAGGDFTTAGGGAPRPGIAALDASSGTAAPLVWPGPGDVRGLATIDGRLFVSDRGLLAAVDPSSGAPAPWHPGVVGDDAPHVDFRSAGAYGVVVGGHLQVGTGPVRSAHLAVFPDPTVTLAGGEAAPGGTAPGADTGAPGTPGGIGGPGADIAPVISGLKLSARRFRVGRRSTALSAARVAVGTTIRFRLSEPARVRFVVERALGGRRVGRSCRKRTRALRGRRRCTRHVRRGVLTRRGRAGANRAAFSGRLGRRPLPRGRYRLVVRATDAAGNRSARRTVTFTVRR